MAHIAHRLRSTKRRWVEILPGYDPDTANMALQYLLLRLGKAAVGDDSYLWPEAGIQKERLNCDQIWVDIRLIQERDGFDAARLAALDRGRRAHESEKQPAQLLQIVFPGEESLHAIRKAAFGHYRPKTSFDPVSRRPHRNDCNRRRR